MFMLCCVHAVVFVWCYSSRVIISVVYVCVCVVIFLYDRSIVKMRLLIVLNDGEFRDIVKCCAYMNVVNSLVLFSLDCVVEKVVKLVILWMLWCDTVTLNWFLFIVKGNNVDKFFYELLIKLLI